MFQKESRYQLCIPFQNESPDTFRFKGIRPRIPEKATPVLEHTYLEGERPDLLALHYYNDQHKWWRILDANLNLLDAGDLATPERPLPILLIPQAEEKQ